MGFRCAHPACFGLFYRFPLLVLLGVSLVGIQFRERLAPGLFGDPLASGGVEMFKSNLPLQTLKLPPVVHTFGVGFLAGKSLAPFARARPVSSYFNPRLTGHKLE